MTKLTAFPSSVTVTPLPPDEVQVMITAGQFTDGYVFREEEWAAVREHVRAEHASELGWWWSKLHPEYFVIASREGMVRVIQAYHGIVTQLNPKECREVGQPPVQVAAEWWHEVGRHAVEACPAALNVQGEHYGCDARDGHGGIHSNQKLQAIWGETRQEDE